MMADLDDEPHFHAPPRYDGAPSCLLCRSTHAAAGHVWCAAAQCLVCTDCCRKLTRGDTDSIVAVAFGTGVSLSPSKLYGGCDGCDQGRLRIVEQIIASSEESETVPC